MGLSCSCSDTWPGGTHTAYASMSRKPKKDIATWVAPDPVLLKVAHKGWLPDDFGCPHCKKTMRGIFVKMVEGLDYWWLCDCGEGQEIEDAYAECKGTHIHSMKYYRLCAWKIQEKVWPE